MTETLAPLLIDGAWTDRGEHVAVTDPVDESTVGSLAWGSATDAVAAADAAARAFGDWSRTTARTRADVLLAAADLIVHRRDHLAQLLAREAGKRLPEAVGADVRPCLERQLREDARLPDAGPSAEG